jgi:hypothetical protein
MSLATGITWAQQALVLPNSRFYSSTPSDISIQQAPLNGVGAVFSYQFPPHSVSVIVINSK